MLSVKILLDGHGWRAGRVLATGAVLLEQTNEVIPPAKIRQIVHYPRGEKVEAPGRVPPPPHEAPPPEAIGWLVLLGTILYEGKRAEFEADAWPTWRSREGISLSRNSNGKLRAAVTQSAVGVLVVTATNAAPVLAATTASGGQGGG